jgi:hypothetical protein
MKEQLWNVLAGFVSMALILGPVLMAAAWIA